MPLKFVLGILFLAIIGFLLIDHARIHNGKFATVSDFRNAVFNAVKSHEGIIFIVVVFAIGCFTGVLASGF